MERLAILPFENLTSNTALDWVSNAGSAIVSYDLTGPRDIHPLRVASIRDARLDGANRRLEGYFANESGALVFHLSLEDGTERRIVRSLLASAQPADVAAAMNRVAKELRASARSFPNCSAAAMRAYGEALSGGGDFGAALQDDPKCAPLYLTSAEALIARGQRDAAAHVCEQALALSNVDPIDRGELEYLSATARNDTAARLQALRKLASMLPSDPELLRGMGDLELATRDIRGAVHSYELAAKAKPDDPLVWNTLGYARAQLHDLAGAREALEQYERTSSPRDANPIDSLGEVSFFCGDFAAAERYFQNAYQKNPAALGARELLKAAQAHMITGDLAGADAIVSRARGASPLDLGEWEFITGRRKKAIARLRALPSNPAIAVQLAIWNAQLGSGTIPPSSGGYMNQALPMLLSGNFQSAAPLLEKVYAATNPTNDGQVRTLLAWCYARMGRTAEARKLLDLYPIPLAGSGDEALLASLVFPKFVALRGEVLGSEKDSKLAAQYAGDAPDHVR